MLSTADSGQTVLLVEQYASQLLDFSGQYGSDDSYSYNASNCLGVPTKFPSYGDFAQTFVIREFGRFWIECPSGLAFRTPYCCNRVCQKYRDFVDLKFQHGIFVSAVYVYETFNPGAVVAIWGGDCGGSWSVLWKCEEGEEEIIGVGHQPRIFSPQISSKTSGFPIQMLRIIFCHDNIPCHTEIDAVALLGTASALPSSESTDKRLRSRLLSTLRIKNISGLQPEKLKAVLKLDLRRIGENILKQPRNVTCNGWFEKLPGEVIFHLFSYLDLVSLCRCCQVCKLFRVMGSDPRMYTRLCLKSLFHLASARCLESLSKRCFHLTHLDLSWCGNYSMIHSDLLQSFIRTSGSGIQFLRLNNCHSAGPAVINEIASTCKGLVELSLSNCHLLEARDFQPIATLVHLRYLNLYRTRIGHRQICDILRRSKRLACLNVSCCSLINGDEVCQILAQTQPDLTSLELWRTANVSSVGIFFLSQLTKLQELDIGWCTSVNAATGCIVQLASSCPALSKLVLTAQRQTSDRDVLEIAKSLLNLRQLDIMGTRHVTYAAVRTLLQSVKHLALLDIGYCEQLEDLEKIKELKREFKFCHFVHTFQ